MRKRDFHLKSCVRPAWPEVGSRKERARGSEEFERKGVIKLFSCVIKLPKSPTVEPLVLTSPLSPSFMALGNMRVREWDACGPKIGKNSLMTILWLKVLQSVLSQFCPRLLHFLFFVGVNAFRSLFFLHRELPLLQLSSHLYCQTQDKTLTEGWTAQPL